MHISARHPWLAFAPLAVTIGVVFAFAGALTVALPSVGRTTSGSPSLLPWVVVGYALAVTAPIPVLGRLSDLRGRRTPYLVGLTVFTAATAACAAAPTLAWLAAARVVQGLGAAAAIAMTTVLLVDLFRGPALTAALGANSAAAAIGQVVGPVVGGIVVDAAGWRALFVGGAAVTAAALAASALTLPDAAVPRRDEPLDVAGGVLSALVLCAAVTAASTASGAVPVVVGLAAVPLMAAAAVGFVAVERRHPAPLLSAEVLRPRRLRASLALALAGYLVAFAQPLAVSLWLQDVRGESASVAAAHLIGAPVATLAAALAAPALARRWRREHLVAAGFALFVTGSVLVGAALLGAPGPAAWSALGLTLVGAGNGVFLTPNTAMIVTGAHDSTRGLVNSLRSTAQNAGSLLGPVVVFAAVGLARHLHGSAAGAGPGLAAVALTLVGLVALAVAWRVAAAPAPVRAS